MLNLVVFGPPGAGKGTQAALISKKYKLTHLSSGEILRNEIKTGKLGANVKKYQDAGKLVPDSLIIAIIEKTLLREAKKNGFIFDGYPRTLKQARALDKFLKNKKINLEAVLNLDLSETEAMKRIIKRAKTSGRSDDNPKTIADRLAVYRQQTIPLLNYYQKQKKIININGRPTIEAVFKTITKNLDKLSS